MTDVPTTKLSRIESAAATGPLSGEQEELLEKARAVVEEKVGPLLWESERHEYFPEEIVPIFAEAGLFGGTIPAEFGGLGWDLITHMLVIEQVSKNSQVLGSYLAVPSGPVGAGLFKYGSREQKERWLKPLAEGTSLAGYGLTEPRSGTDAANMITRAERTADGWILNGAKMWIDWAEMGDFFLTFARTDPDSKGARGITSFVVERGTEGFSTHPQKGKLGLRSLSVGELRFEDALLPDENRIGEVGKGFRVAMGALEDTRLQIAARVCGGLAGCLEETAQYATGRELFGKTLAGFQLTQSKVADMILALEASRSLTYQAARSKAAGEEATREVIAAKLFAQEAYMRTSHDATQILGGRGIIDETLVNRHYRDAKITELTGGSNEILRLLLSESVLGRQR
jgi:alkylation response protein AidB-like acyl-CoA dehydrogenase